jgi:hypothetical protein
LLEFTAAKRLETGLHAMCVCDFQAEAYAANINGQGGCNLCVAA